MSRVRRLLSNTLAASGGRTSSANAGGQGYIKGKKMKDKIWRFGRETVDMLIEVALIAAALAVVTVIIQTAGRGW